DSVAEEVTHRAGTPTLLIPPTAPAEWPAAQSPRLVLPLDGSDVSELAIAPAAALAEALGAEVVLVRAVEQPGSGGVDVPGLPGRAYGELPTQPLLDEASRYLERTAELPGLRGRVATSWVPLA